MGFVQDIQIILNNLKGLFLIIGIVMLAMAIFSWWVGDAPALYGFLSGAVLGIGTGLVIRMLVPGNINPELKHAMIIAALAYLIVPAISMIPFMTLANMSPLDAFFESISGWTGSGFSMLSSPETAPPMVQFWRSVTQWIGGLGVIVLMVTILIRPGTSTYMFYQSEAHKDKIHPSIRSTIKTIWALYIVLSICGFLLLYAAGMPVWDATNTAMTAIGTGGFALYGSSLAAYDNILIELVILPIIIAGAMPFVVIYRMFRKGPGSLLKNVQVRTFFMIIAIGSVVLTIQNYFFYNDIVSSLRYSVFQFISAITSAGFQTADLSSWTTPALLIMSVAMVIGGCAGSTSSGIKIARAIFLGDQIRLWFAKVLRSKNAIAVIKIGNKRVTEDLVAAELTEATFISFLWVVGIVLSVFIIANIVGPTYDLGHIIFEVSSAMGNVGITCGLVNPGLSALGKIVFIFDMWIGRLEIIPVMLLARYVLNGFKF
ncbi:TrkH family potassium uptake protein [Methanocella sp. MCL-LM]|uniref:TrkH family potassium uptake protein n=1 Tax=Methanocella sp. MCL-LM TaxID=3412035 RepID=UPI003C753958